MENRIDVEDIMREVREEVEKRKLNGEIIPFEKIPVYWEDGDCQGMVFDFDELKQETAFLNNNYRIQAYRELKSRPVVGGIILFLKKILRKSMKFYIEPIVNDQNEINSAVMSCMNQINYYIQGQISLQKEIMELQEKVLILEKENAELRQKCN